MNEIKYNLGAEYYADTASPANLNGKVSKSMLFDFMDRGAFKWRNSGPKVITDAMVFGQLVHAMAFTSESVDREFLVSPFDDYRTKAAREWRDEQKMAGKAVIKESDHNLASKIVDRISNTEELYHYGACKHEVAVYGDIGPSTLKCMIDIVPDHGDCLADLKTIEVIESPDQLQKVIFNRGYHWQAALYLDLFNAATGDGRNQFELLFIEKSFPYETALVSLDHETIAQGREGYMNALAKFQQCVRTNEWPTNVPRGYKIGVPNWMKKSY